MSEHVTVNSAASSDWDALVIGAGMGGGAVSYELTKRGFSVLVIEKGGASFQVDESGLAATSEDPDYRIRHGYWPNRLNVRIDQTSSLIWPAMGCGVGGSTSLYAAALGRLEPVDFLEQKLPDGRLISWPFSYHDLEPYYLKVEELFGVNGTEDPRFPNARYHLKDPPAMGDRDRYFFQQMQTAGLNPYRLHNAIRYDPGCTECGGAPCLRECKGDARNRLFEPARLTGKLQILHHTEVIRLDADRQRVTGIVVQQNDQQVSLRADTVVLAAGALATPALLQKSKSESWPNGVANDNDLVGRNLMFHASDFVAVWPRRSAARSGPSRTIALRDFYAVDGSKLGEFQSMGLTAGYGEILTFLYQAYDRSPLRRVKPLRHFLRIPAYLGAKAFSEASIFSTIVEDLPYEHNRVTADAKEDSGFTVDYQIPANLKERVHTMRRLLKSRLKGMVVVIANRDVSLNFGHGCGTCRAGTSADSSVVDVDCRAHGLTNLYITDGSIMPTSGGTNPSLTIAANALRVGEKIADQLTLSQRRGR